MVFDTAGLAIAATSSTCLGRADIVVGMVRLNLYGGENRTEADHDACLRATLAVAVVDKEEKTLSKPSVVYRILFFCRNFKAWFMLCLVVVQLHSRKAVLGIKCLRLQ